MNAEHPRRLAAALAAAVAVIAALVVVVVVLVTSGGSSSGGRSAKGTHTVPRAPLSTRTTTTQGDHEKPPTTVHRGPVSINSSPSALSIGPTYVNEAISKTLAAPQLQVKTTGGAGSSYDYDLPGRYSDMFTGRKLTQVLTGGKLYAKVGSCWARSADTSAPSAQAELLTILVPSSMAQIAYTHTVQGSDEIIRWHMKRTATTAPGATLPSGQLTIDTHTHRIVQAKDATPAITATFSYPARVAHQSVPTRLCKAETP